MSSYAQWKTDAIDRIGPAPSDDPVDRLRHAVRVYEETSDEERVITATSGVYGEGEWTGLTWGDLRAILDRCDEADR